MYKYKYKYKYLKYFKKNIQKGGTILCNQDIGSDAKILSNLEFVKIGDNEFSKTEQNMTQKVTIDRNKELGRGGLGKVFA